MKYSEGVLVLVHLDLWGLALVVARGGAKYFVTIIDDYLRMMWLCLIWEKLEVFFQFRAWRAEIEKEIGRQVKCLGLDDGVEYISLEFRRYCVENGIKHHYTMKMISSQNGVMERMNKTLTKKA